MFIFLFLLVDFVLTKTLIGDLFIEQYDSTLGWRLKSGVDKFVKAKSSHGLEYEVYFKTEKDGFREFGRKADGYRILILGDSYTGDLFSSNSDMYYSRLREIIQKEKNISSELFVIAAGGWSTAQMYLAFRKNVDMINPDLVILQTCVNDLYENSLNYDSYYPLSIDYILRPHYENNFKQDSSSFYKKIVKFMFLNFSTFKLIIKSIDIYDKKWSPLKVINNINDPALDNTKEILKLFSKHTFGDKVINTVCSCGQHNHDNLTTWVNIAKDVGLRSYAEPALKIIDLEKKGNDLRHEDKCHLNPEGNRVWAEELYKIINSELVFNYQ